MYFPYEAEYRAHLCAIVTKCVWIPRTDLTFTIHTETWHSSKICDILQCFTIRCIFGMKLMSVDLPRTLWRMSSYYVWHLITYVIRLMTYVIFNSTLLVSYLQCLTTESASSAKQIEPLHRYEIKNRHPQSVLIQPMWLPCQQLRYL